MMSAGNVWKRNIRMVSSLLLGVLVLGGSVARAAGGTSRDSHGTDFWVAFMQNYTGAPTLSLFITSGEACSGTVTCAAISFSTTFAVAPNVVTTVVVPTTAMVSGTGVAAKMGIHVTATKDVTVYGLNRIPYTTDAFLALPTDILSTNYLVMAYQSSSSGSSEFLVLATTSNTTVISTAPGGSPATTVLNQGDAYEFQNSSGDVTGTKIVSDKPVAVYGGNTCANIPVGYTYCDHIVEQIPPLDTWGRNFVTEPLATRLGDTFRVLAQQAATVVNINGSNVVTLASGQFYTTILSNSAVIMASQPILVAQFSNSTSYDGVISDPFMMLVTPYEQFLGDYTVTTPETGFRTNFVNVVAPSAAVGSISLDGANITPSAFAAIGGSGFSGAKVPIQLGSHHLVGSLPFGLFVYGFDEADSYGYPGGMSLSDVARVIGVKFGPKTSQGQVGTTNCFTGTVTDQNSNGVAGVRVDFTIDGANPNQSGFATTANNGVAQFCYAAANPGVDYITASVGGLSDEGTCQWTGSGVNCSTASRELPNCGYRPGTNNTIVIVIVPCSNTQYYAVEDVPPTGWPVSKIDNGGTTNNLGKITWGPWNDNVPRTVTYQVTPPLNQTGLQSFDGTASFDGTDMEIGGSNTLDKCLSLPTWHPADRNGNFRMVISEVTGYGAAWMKGTPWMNPPNPIPINYVTRAAYLWKQGEFYHYVSGPVPPLGWVTGMSPVPTRAARGLEAASSGSAQRAMPSNYAPGVATTVTVTVTPDDGVSAYAVEDAPPTGWTVSGIDNNGVWDNVNKKVNWLFTDNSARTLSYQATPPVGTTGLLSFSGLVSFDGVSVAIGGANTIDGVRNVATPTIAPNGGTFTNSVKVKVSCSTKGAKIYYTLDGQQPTSHSKVYPAAGLTITNSLTLKVTALKGKDSSTTATAAFVIYVPPAPNIDPASPVPATATVKVAYTGLVQVVAGTGIAPLKWSLEPKSKLPAGLTLNPTTGRITGKPTKAGPCTFTVRVTDAKKRFDTQVFTLTVAAP